MAAALMRERYADAVRVFSGGTRPGSALNAESVRLVRDDTAARVTRLGELLGLQSGA